KKVEKVPFFRTIWFQALGILALVSALGLVLYLLFKPISEEKLYTRIERLMTSKETEDRRTALEGPVKEYLRRFGSENSEKTAQVRRWQTEAGLEMAEEDLASIKAKVANGFKLEKMTALSEAGRTAVRASQAEDEGNLEEGLRLWQEVEKQ